MLNKKAELNEFGFFLLDMIQKEGWLIQKTRYFFAPIESNDLIFTINTEH